MTQEQPVDLAKAVAGWEPAPLTSHDQLAPGPAAALHAVLDRPGPPPAAGEALPVFWHWLYFLRWPAHSELGPDGHPARGHFLPPLPDRRRMFAGGRIRIHRPLLLGEPATRVSSLVSAVVKSGRTGEMLFVTVRDEISQGGRLAVVEEQDLMYRSGAPRPTPDSGRPATRPADQPSPGQPSPRQPSPRQSSSGQPPSGRSPEDGGPEAARPRWEAGFVGDPVRLMRFSALTANAHRIHYDQPYTTEVEGYPGLVVHGPLLVLLMTGLVPAPAGTGAGGDGSAQDGPADDGLTADRIAAVDYRLRRPVFVGEALRVTGHPTGIRPAADQPADQADSRSGARPENPASDSADARAEAPTAELRILGPGGDADVRATAQVTFSP